MTADLYKEFNFSGIIGNRGLPPPRAIMTTMPAGDMKFRTMPAQVSPVGTTVCTGPPAGIWGLARAPNPMWEIDASEM